MNPKLTEEIKILINSYIDNELNDEERQKAEDILITNKDARQYYIELTKLSSFLSNWDDEPFSADLDVKLARRIKERTMNTKPKYFLTGAASAFVVLVAVVVVGNLYQGTMKEIRQNDIEKHLPAQTAVLGTTNQYAAYYQFVDDVSTVSKTSVDKRESFKKDSQTSTVSRGSTSTRSAEQWLSPNKTNHQLPQEIGYSRSVAREAINSRITTAPKMEAKFKSQIRAAGYLPTYNVGDSSYGSQHRSSQIIDSQVVSADYDINCHQNWCQRPVNIREKQFNTEEYDQIVENPFLDTTENPLSTFSIDVDTSSYSNIRRFLNSGKLPPKDSVRIEEMINYFSYDYPEPKGNDSFSITTKAAAAPWNPEHRLVMIGLQGKRLQSEELPPSNLVFLIDVSGSMNQQNKLPLLKEAFRMMVNNISENERVAIVTYAGSAGLVLESTPGNDKQKILSAIDRLQSGGSTAGGAGIKLAYSVAQENFIEGGNNRVILATDGDFNVGTSSDGELVRLIEEKRDSNIFLTILGFGTGNYKDAKMEKIANNGNGTYHYIDTPREAKKVLVKELGSTLFTIAKDVKLQIEFNPAQTKAYRLIGYENRMLAKEDFNDDTKDAGELGAGHTVTAIYELIPADAEENLIGTVDALKYQAKKLISSDDLMTVKLRYKDLDKNKSKLIEQTIQADEIMQNISGDFQFAAAVAEFGLLLRDSKFKGNAHYNNVLNAAYNSLGKDSYGYRQEFMGLVQKAQNISGPLPADPVHMQFK